MEVFFCTAPRSPERERIAAEMLGWWKSQPVRLSVYTPKVLGCDPFHFQRLRRMVADENCNGKFYILTDDDCQPQAGCIEALEDAIEGHPDFGLISAWPANANIGRWTPAGYEPFEDMKVTEVHDVGGLRMCRKWAVRHWPMQLRVGYDQEHAAAMRSNGYRVGYSQHGRQTHLGEGCSDIWRVNDSHAELASIGNLQRHGL